MKKYITWIVIIGFLVINLVTLTLFPSVHSDELWLKGLSTQMTQTQNFWTTEPFYDLYPRVVHPFRWLYTALQATFIFIFGNSIFSMRLLSLLFATISLWLFDKIVKQQSSIPMVKNWGVLLLAAQIQFIYLAHIGRQDTLILCLSLAAYWYIIQNKTWRACTIIAIAIGVHPNALLIAAGIFAVTIANALTRKSTLAKAAKLLTGLSLAFAIYLFIGYQHNPHLLKEYFAFGATLGVDAPITGRLEGFYWFWHKLYHQIGGTYDLMNIKPFLILGFGIFLPSLWTAFSAVIKKTSTHTQPIAMFLGILIGLLAIGRYNALSVLFVLPWVILITLNYFELKPMVKFAPLLLSLMAIISLWNTYTNITRYHTNRPYSLDYPAMIESIQQIIPQDAVVLGNLNTIETTQNNLFYDIRNLAFLDASDITIGQYIHARNIKYIIWHEELDYILRNSPKWDFMYSNTSGILALKDYIEENATLIGAFENPLYAMRISKYSGTYPFTTKIYQIKTP